MVEISYKKHVQVDEKQELVVCYNLLSESKKYHVECYIENSEEKNYHTYCLIKDFTTDRQFAAQFVSAIAKGEALPIHIVDILEDYRNE